jgi:hypothetical protein
MSVLSQPIDILFNLFILIGLVFALSSFKLKKLDP